MRYSVSMNDIYEHLRELFESYDVIDPTQRDELGAAVVRQTLHKLFVLEPLHPDGELDVDVICTPEEGQLVDPDRFTITSYTIRSRVQRYEIELVAEHDELDYTYEFDGAIQRSGTPSVLAQRAKIEGQASPA